MHSTAVVNTGKGINPGAGCMPLHGWSASSWPSARARRAPRSDLERMGIVPQRALAWDPAGAGGQVQLQLGQEGQPGHVQQGHPEVILDGSTNAKPPICDRGTTWLRQIWGKSAHMLQRGAHTAKFLSTSLVKIGTGLKCFKSFGKLTFSI